MWRRSEGKTSSVFVVGVNADRLANGGDNGRGEGGAKKSTEIYVITCVTIIAVRYSREAEAEQPQGVGKAVETRVKPDRSHSEVTENYWGNDPSFSGCILAWHDYHSVFCSAYWLLAERAYLS